MFDANSRYAKLGTNIFIRPSDGLQIPWVQRRFLPAPASVGVAGTVEVKTGDRLDNIAARTLGDPTLFWRIADANHTLDPFQLCQPGKVLRIPRL